MVDSWGKKLGGGLMKRIGEGKDVYERGDLCELCSLDMLQRTWKSSPVSDLGPLASSSPFSLIQASILLACSSKAGT